MDSKCEESSIRADVMRRNLGAPHTIICSFGGDVSWLEKSSISCQKLRSAPFPKAAKLSIVPSPKANVLVFRREGALSMFHADTGVQLPLSGGEIGSNVCSAVAASSDGGLLAIGLFSGRVIIYAMPKMLAIKILDSPFSDKANAAAAMVFTHGNHGLVVAYEKSGVYLSDLHKPISEPLQRLLQNTGEGSVILFNEFKNDSYLGLLQPESSSIILYRVLQKKSSKSDSKCLSFNILWEGRIKEKLTLNKFSIGRSIHDAGVKVVDANLISFEDGFLLKVLHNQHIEEKGNVTCLSTVVAERRKIYEDQVLMKEVQLKNTMNLDGYLAHAFANDLLIVSTNESVFIYGIGRKQFGTVSAIVLAKLNAEDCMLNIASWTFSSLCTFVAGAEEGSNERMLEIFVSLTGSSRPYVEDCNSSRQDGLPRCPPSLLRIKVKVYGEHENSNSIS